MMTHPEINGDQLLHWQCDQELCFIVMKAIIGALTDHIGIDEMKKWFDQVVE